MSPDQSVTYVPARTFGEVDQPLILANPVHFQGSENIVDHHRTRS
jgi:hypothetical protein